MPLMLASARYGLMVRFTAHSLLSITSREAEALDAHESIGEEASNAVGVAQRDDVDELLGGAVPGQAADVCGDVVHKAVGDC